MGCKGDDSTKQHVISEYPKVDAYKLCIFFDRNLSRYRALELDQFNARAGFSEGEVEFYHETFNTYDKDGGGDLYNLISHLASC